MKANFAPLAEVIVVVPQRVREVFHRVGQLADLAVEPEDHERGDGNRKAEIPDEPHEQVFQRIPPETKEAAAPPRISARQDGGLPSDHRIPRAASSGSLRPL
jgi:hypothetical protein